MGGPFGRDALQGKTVLREKEGSTSPDSVCSGSRLQWNEYSIVNVQEKLLRFSWLEHPWQSLSSQGCCRDPLLPKAVIPSAQSLFPCLLKPLGMGNREQNRPHHQQGCPFMLVWHLINQNGWRMRLCGQGLRHVGVPPVPPNQGNCSELARQPASPWP